MQKSSLHVLVAPKEESNPVVFWRLPWLNGSVTVGVCYLPWMRPNYVIRFNVGWHDCCKFHFDPSRYEILERVRKVSVLSLSVMQGDAGGPVLLLNEAIDVTEKALIGLDTIVGIISYVNNSALGESGITCIKASSIRGWIWQIAPVEVLHYQNHFSWRVCTFASLNTETYSATSEIYKTTQKTC